MQHISQIIKDNPKYKKILDNKKCSVPHCNELSAVGGMCLEHYQELNNKTN